MQNYKDQALKDINENVHTRGTIEVLDDDTFYFKLLFLENQTNENNETIIKLVELSDTEFREDNKIYRYSLEELIEARAYFLKREKEKKDNFSKLYPNLKSC